MSRVDRYKKHIKGGYYHVFNRGNNKENIFFEKEDYIKYLRLMNICKGKCGIEFVCYVLMSNHLHFLIRQLSDIPVPKFIQSLHTRYTKYINAKYCRIGKLFQGRYKQRSIKDISHILWVSGYIHTNPLVGGIVENLDKWQWSSYMDYIGLRNGKLCNKNIILYQFNNVSEYKIYIAQCSEDLIKRKEMGRRL